MPKIPFKIEHQLRSEWCWAAITSSVSDYYSPKASWCQCKLASEMVRRTSNRRQHCCRPLSGGLLKACNQDWFLASALRIVGRGGGRLKFGRLSFQAIRKNIRAGFPICVRIGWPDGSGHFVVIIGCNQSSNGDEWVYVDDPLHGHGTWLYQEFCGNYHNAGGRWTVTFPLKGQKLHAAH